jgi:serine protease Do
MRKLALQSLFIFLILVITVMGFFFAFQTNQLKNTQSQITELISEVSILHNNQSYSDSDTSSNNSIPIGDLITNIQPVIVKLDITGDGFKAAGSGIIIKYNGYVVTNAHVIQQAVSINVILDNGQHYPAILIDANTDLDLAILKFDDNDNVLPMAVLGSSSDIIVGATVVAAGFPMALELPGPVSFTQGIISAIRNINGQNYIQSDALIIHGNSGGALIVRESSKVIGITSARILPDGEGIKGIGLAIPIDVIQSYIKTVTLN